MLNEGVSHVGPGFPDIYSKMPPWCFITVVQQNPQYCNKITHFAYKKSIATNHRNIYKNKVVKQQFFCRMICNKNRQQFQQKLKTITTKKQSVYNNKKSC